MRFEVLGKDLIYEEVNYLEILDVTLGIVMDVPSLKRGYKKERLFHYRNKRSYFNDLKYCIRLYSIKISSSFRDETSNVALCSSPNR